MKITIEVDDIVVDHINGKDGSTCGAGTHDPCAFSESIMYAVAQAVKQPAGTIYRDTRGMDRVYGGEEPPFGVNDEFAASGDPSDY